MQINVAESDQDVKITNASFLSIYNRYLSAKNNGGSGLHANGNAIGPWETFDIVLESSNADPNCIEGGDSVSIDTQNGYYALVTQKGGLNAKASSVSKSETFIILRADNGSGCIQSGDSIVLQSSFGKYVGAKKNGRANAKLTSINNRALFTLAY